MAAEREEVEPLLGLGGSGAGGYGTGGGGRPRGQVRGTGVSEWKGLRRAAKFLLHIVYVIIMLGCFGGLISERETLWDRPRFTFSFLAVTFILGAVPCSLLFFLVSKWPPLHNLINSLFYLTMVASLGIDCYLFFLPPMHWIGEFETDEKWPKIQEITKWAMNWSIPNYSHGAYLAWDTIQPSLKCCGVKADDTYCGWKDLQSGWQVPPSCCKPGYETCMENATNDTAYLETGCLPKVMPFVKISLFEVRIWLFFSLAFSIAGLEAILMERILRVEGRPRRMVKLGRKIVGLIFHHWAVQVDQDWFEIGRDGLCISRLVADSPGYNMVTRGTGRAAPSSAGNWGGEIVGWTTKSDEEIVGASFTNWIAQKPSSSIVEIKRYKLTEHCGTCCCTETGYRVVPRLGMAVEEGLEDGAGEGAGAEQRPEACGMECWTDEEAWIKDWLKRNPMYSVESDNCQKFAYEFLVWLTDGVFTVPHRFDAAHSISAKGRYGGFSAYKDGNTIYRYGSGDHRVSMWYVGLIYRWTEFQFQRICSGCSPGLGLFFDASVMRLEISLANFIGIHIDYNLNTGLGVRNGNFECHVLGCGGKLGVDGVEVNTFFAGVNGIMVLVLVWYGFI